jgi:hypothetical protein
MPLGRSHVFRHEPTTFGGAGAACLGLSSRDYLTFDPLEWTPKERVLERASCMCTSGRFARTASRSSPDLVRASRISAGTSCNVDPTCAFSVASDRGGAGSSANPTDGALRRLTVEGSSRAVAAGSAPFLRCSETPPGTLLDIGAFGDLLSAMHFENASRRHTGSHSGGCDAMRSGLYIQRSTLER